MQELKRINSVGKQQKPVWDHGGSVTPKQKKGGWVDGLGTMYCTVGSYRARRVLFRPPEGYSGRLEKVGGQYKWRERRVPSTVIVIWCDGRVHHCSGACTCVPHSGLPMPATCSTAKQFCVCEAGDGFFFFVSFSFPFSLLQYCNASQNNNNTTAMLRTVY